VTVIISARLTQVQIMMPAIFTVDVEDWFHILEVAGTPAIEDWDRLPSRVEANFRRLLDLCEGAGVEITCFFLGWVAERFPHLVREAAARGHEVASHGFGHRLVYEQSPAAFYKDALKARLLLEDISGGPVQGYRGAGFSVTAETPWFFEELVKAGYEYDSSIFPAARGHGGLRQGRFGPYWIKTPSGPLVEFPITVAAVGGRPMCFFGGGYLRLFPYALVRRMARRVQQEGRPVVFYAHPREIDPDHPRLTMNWQRRFKSYVGLRSMEGKIRRIFQDFPITSFARFRADFGDTLGT
jgi:polysaccharide deacetylase family protein (PEP-CTERM system associated)